MLTSLAFLFGVIVGACGMWLRMTRPDPADWRLPRPIGWRMRRWWR